MKKFIAVFLSVLCTGALLTGCSGAGTSNEDMAAEEAVEILNEQYAVYDEAMDLLTDLLPARITHLSYGGIIPDEYYNPDKEPARYDPCAFLGRWCAEAVAEDSSAQATDVTIDAGFGGSSSEIETMTCLPDTIVFGLGSEGYAVDSIMDMYIYCSTYLLADFSYRNQNGSSFTAILPFEIQGNTLAAGFYDSSGSDAAVLSQEMDYLIDWTGWKLTLTYGDESVTYIPKAYADDGDVTNGGDIIAGYEGIDGITSIDPAGSTVSYGDEVKKASFDFNEDGTATIKVKGGNTYQLQFRYSGSTLTLINGSHAALYGAY